MNHLKMIILVGLPGSGKSTLALQLPDYNRICQDLLGNRKDCESAAKRFLSQGKSVIIDRTNISKEQRRYFINIAKDFNAKVYCIFFRIPMVECIKRVKERKGHKTIPSGTPDSKIEEIVNKFSNSLEAPEWIEGYENIHIITTGTDVSVIINEFQPIREESITNSRS
jgi:bifunctional polynucleotide phosphatase/kinase